MEANGGVAEATSVNGGVVAAIGAAFVPLLGVVQPRRRARHVAVQQRVVDGRRPDVMGRPDVKGRPGGEAASYRRDETPGS